MYCCWRGGWGVLHGRPKQGQSLFFLVSRAIAHWPVVVCHCPQEHSSLHSILGAIGHFLLLGGVRYLCRSQLAHLQRVRESRPDWIHRCPSRHCCDGSTCSTARAPARPGTYQVSVLSRVLRAHPQSRSQLAARTESLERRARPNPECPVRAASDARHAGRRVCLRSPCLSPRIFCLHPGAGCPSVNRPGKEGIPAHKSSLWHLRVAPSAWLSMRVPVASSGRTFVVVPAQPARARLRCTSWHSDGQSQPPPGRVVPTRFRPSASCIDG
ncbi:hypothetical protein SAMN04515660_1358 [Luteibacter sp. 329MFSha]|nr:hypothetical protein SAMN04515660_1358 [Luteibacter sp. 329MFSha]